jgi:aromatic amino acid transport protein AroP
VGILSLMWITGMKLPVALIPVWIVFLYGCYLAVKRNKLISAQG